MHTILTVPNQTWKCRRYRRDRYSTNTSYENWLVIVPWNVNKGRAFNL